MTGGYLLGSWKFTSFEKVYPYVLAGGGGLYNDLGLAWGVGIVLITWLSRAVVLPFTNDQFLVARLVEARVTSWRPVTFASIRRLRRRMVNRTGRSARR